jgi:low affinity Fe/Cu permease
MIYIIITLSILLILAIFIIVNLLIRNEKQEDILIEYFKYIDKISKVITISSKKIKEVDYAGSFENDDETGTIFKSIKEIQDILNQFIVHTIKEEEDAKKI